MRKNNLRRCLNCDLPETYETIEFDAAGICNICSGTRHKQQAIDWDERKQLLDKLVEKHRGKSDYDCIVPFWGGKDSTFQLYYLINEYKLKPLVVRFNHGFMRQIVEENNQRTFKKLGVDVLEFTPKLENCEAPNARVVQEKNRFLLALSYWYLFLSSSRGLDVQDTPSVLG